mgnify:CR=1 FL=1
MSDYKVKKWDEVHGDTASEEKMTAFLEAATDSYAILQLKNTEEYALERFASMELMKRMDREPEIDHYEVIYTGQLPKFNKVSALLEDLYTKFNIAHPKDFYGHSMSVSDIVALKVNGVVSSHYVDSIGFKELQNFIQRENYLKDAEMVMEDDYGIIDGIINNGTREEKKSVLEQLKGKTMDAPFKACPKEEREI